jgi:hypothetical protein
MRKRKMPYIHKLNGRKTQSYSTGASIAVDTSKSLPVAKSQSAEVIPEKIKVENMKIREVSPEMKQVKVAKKYIHF